MNGGYLYYYRSRATDLDIAALLRRVARDLEARGEEPLAYARAFAARAEAEGRETYERCHSVPWRDLAAESAD